MLNLKTSITTTTNMQSKKPQCKICMPKREKLDIDLPRINPKRKLRYVRVKGKEMESRACVENKSMWVP